MSTNLSKSKSDASTRRLTGLSMLTAIVAVLTVLGTFIRFGPFTITLSLAPIVVGAALYGPSAGAILGTVFGVVVLLTGIAGWDGGTVMLLLGISPVALVLVCVLKGTGAGWVSGLVYRAISKHNEKLAVLVAGILCPVTNTGLFIIGMLLFFTSTLESWASGQGVLYYIIFGLTGINFLVELAINIILSSGITAIIKYTKGRKH